MPIAASCHCGAVRIEMARKPHSLTACTCSVCRRYGAQWAYATRKTVKVYAGKGALKGYSWGDRMIEFFHCTTCGCLTHYASTLDRSDQGRMAVNARMIDPADIEGARLRLFDGAATWKYLD